MHLQPFAEGNVGEVEDNMVRIYDCTGFPRIELFRQDHETDAELQQLATDIRELLNGASQCE